MRFSELLSRSCRCDALIGKTQKMLDRISLKDLSDGVMYAKIRAKNWATLLKIKPQKVPKIKSVAQFNKRIRFHMQRTEPAPHSSSGRNTAKSIDIWSYAMSIKPRDRADLTNQKSCV